MSEIVRSVYLDSAASSVPEPDVLREIEECNRIYWQNPSSVYKEGIHVRRKVEESRKKIRKFLGGKENDKIIFTSSGTESNNLAIQGYQKSHPECEHITTLTNHPSLYRTNLINNDEPVYIPVTNEGRMDLEKLEIYLSMKSGIPHIISVSLVNSEIGVIESVNEISRIIHKYPNNVLLVDACQAIGHMPIDTNVLNCDMLTFTSEKMGMPRGCGVLFVKENIEISPLIYGGKQEKGYRSGTENTSMIIALGSQCERLSMSITNRSFQEYRHKASLIKEIDKACKSVKCDYKIFGCKFNSSKDFISYSIYSIVDNIISVIFKGIDNQQLLTLLDIHNIQCSAGSACSSGDRKPSKVLLSVGYTEEEASSTLRFSFDYRLTQSEIIFFGKELTRVLASLIQ